MKKPEINKNGELHWMALAFQELTGIEPLSIDQTEMSEANKPENENPDYLFAVDNGLVKDRPVVLRDKENGNHFIRTANGVLYDLTVIHPRSRYENGRPTWLAMGGRRTSHEVKTEVRPSQGASYLRRLSTLRKWDRKPCQSTKWSTATASRFQRSGYRRGKCIFGSWMKTPTCSMSTRHPTDK